MSFAQRICKFWAYFISDYLSLLCEFKTFNEFLEEVQIIVPSGNFGNALGAFMLKMGANFKIKIASNVNNILSEFLIMAFMICVKKS